ncbi:hypothetical protein M5K25_025008 [Dendrobium thyrsiflorum]|uniref:Uncharacterized protein n=1 Tax=Dendrobium thyrsiflorum TaxID=117978 RepID=A0ABD0U3D0_DENTH
MSIERDLISAVHSNHSKITHDLSFIYELCHSQKSINRALISLKRGGRARKKKKRREEGKEGRNTSSTSARPPSNAGSPPGLQVTPDFPPASNNAGSPPGLQAKPEFPPASKRSRSSTRPPSNAGSPPGLQVTPDFPPASNDAGLPPGLQVTLEFRPASKRRRSSARPPSDAGLPPGLQSLTGLLLLGQGLNLDLKKGSNGLKTDHFSPLIRDTRHSPPPNQGQSIPGGFDSTSSTQVNVIEQGSDKEPRIEHTSLLNIIKRHSDKLQNSLVDSSLYSRGPGPEQGMPPVQGQGKASTEIEGGRKANKLAVKLSVSKIQTQRHQIRLNPSPNESKSRTQSAVGRDLISAVHSNHSKITHDLSFIYELCHSQKSINRALISLKRGGRARKKKKRREEGKEGRNTSSTSARPPSNAGSPPGLQVTPDFPPASNDAGLPPGLQVTPEFRPASKRGQSSPRPPSNAGSPPGLQAKPEFPPASKRSRSSTRPPSNAGSPPGLQVTPDFPPASNDAGLPPGLQVTLEFRPASKRRRSSARPPSDAGLPPGLQVTPDLRPASK